MGERCRGEHLTIIESENAMRFFFLSSASQFGCLRFYLFFGILLWGCQGVSGWYLVWKILPRRCSSKDVCFTFKAFWPVLLGRNVLNSLFSSLLSASWVEYSGEQNFCVYVLNAHCLFLISFFLFNVAVQSVNYRSVFCMLSLTSFPTPPIGRENMEQWNMICDQCPQVFGWLTGDSRDLRLYSLSMSGTTAEKERRWIKTSCRILQGTATTHGEEGV